MILQFLPILPIVSTIIVFLLSRKTFLSLFAGCISGALILTNAMPIQSFWLFCIKFIQANQFDYFTSLPKLMTSTRIPLYLFILFLNIYISLIHQSGIAYGYYNFLSDKLKSKKGAEFATLFLGLFLFVDDYLNIITNTKVSSLFSHRFKIPKIKICFLAACLAGPLCSLIPISSWGAEIITTISASTSNTVLSGIDSFSILISSLPFVFFSLLIICASFLIVWRRYSFGVIFQEEVLLDSKNDSEHLDVPSNFLHFNIWHFVFPIFSMVGLILTSMLFFGNYFSGTISFFSALKTNPFPEKSLLLGTSVTLMLVLIVFLQMRLISFSNFYSAIKDGFSETITIFLLLSFSGTFAAFIKALGTGELLCELAQPLISATYLPASIFATTSALSFLLGSSWATMIILIPATLPIVQGILSIAQAPIADIQYLMFVSIGAVLSGAVFGSSLSPISDLVNMATKSCQISHSRYLTVQFQYGVIVGIASIVAFLISGFLVGHTYLFCWGISFGSALFLMILIFKLMTIKSNQYLNSLKND